MYHPSNLLLLITSIILAVSSSGEVLQGELSYYNDKYHGNPTASGEPYDKNKFTAASSKGHPFGTMLKVTNLKNGRAVVVKVNDKMGNKTRILDLSRAAAEEIDMVRAGVIQAKVEPFKAGSVASAPTTSTTTSGTPAPAAKTLTQPTSATKGYRLQYGSFNDKTKAEAHSKSLQSAGIMAEVVLRAGAHKVLAVRRFPTKDLATQQVSADLKSAGFESFVVSY